MTYPRIDDLEDFPEAPAAAGQPQEDPSPDDLEDFPDSAANDAAESAAAEPEQGFEPQAGATAPDTRRARGKRGRRRRGVLVVGSAAAVAVLAAGGVWFAVGQPGLPAPEITTGPVAVPADPSMGATEVPYEDIAEPEPAPAAEAGDVLGAEPTDLPQGLTARQQGDGTWLVVADLDEDGQRAAVADSVAEAVDAAGLAEGFDSEKMTAMISTFEQQDGVLFAATGQQLIATYPMNGSTSAWAAVRGEDGMVSSVYTAIGEDATGAEAALRELASGAGVDLGERLVVNAGAS